MKCNKKKRTVSHTQTSYVFGGKSHFNSMTLFDSQMNQVGKLQAFQNERQDIGGCKHVNHSWSSYRRHSYRIDDSWTEDWREPAKYELVVSCTYVNMYLCMYVCIYLCIYACIYERNQLRDELASTVFPKLAGHNLCMLKNRI